MRIGKSDNQNINTQLEWCKNTINTLREIQKGFPFPVSVYQNDEWSQLDTTIRCLRIRIGQLLAQQYLQEQ